MSRLPDKSGLPQKDRQRSLARRAVTQLGAGPTLLAAGVGLFVVTRVINWLPLGLIDGPINALIWPAIIVCVVVGGGLTWRKMALRTSAPEPKRNT